MGGHLCHSGAGSPRSRPVAVARHSSWLNQVELWFSKIERDVLARDISMSVADLACKIRRCIHRYDKAP
jgi:hypothetical protein